MNEPTPAHLVSLTEAAARMGVHRTTAYQQYRQPEDPNDPTGTGTAFPLRVMKVGSLLKVNSRDLEDFIEGRLRTSS